MPDQTGLRDPSGRKMPRDTYVLEDALSPRWGRIDLKRQRSPPPPLGGCYEWWSPWRGKSEVSKPSMIAIADNGGRKAGACDVDLQRAGDASKPHLK